MININMDDAYMHQTINALLTKSDAYFAGLKLTK